MLSAIHWPPLPGFRNWNFYRTLIFGSGEIQGRLTQEQPSSLVSKPTLAPHKSRNTGENCATISSTLGISLVDLTEAETVVFVHARHHFFYLSDQGVSKVCMARWLIIHKRSTEEANLL